MYLNERLQSTTVIHLKENGNDENIIAIQC